MLTQVEAESDLTDGADRELVMRGPGLPGGAFEPLKIYGEYRL